MVQEMYAPKLIDANHMVIRCQWRDVFLMFWRQAPDTDVLEKIDLEMIDLADRSQNGIGIISIIYKDARPPDQHGRR